MLLMISPRIYLGFESSQKSHFVYFDFPKCILEQYSIQEITNKWVSTIMTKINRVYLVILLICAATMLAQSTLAINTVTTTINVGNQPSSVAFSPDGSHAYITHYSNSQVSVLAPQPAM